MSGINLKLVGGLLVTGATLTAVVLSQSALAQQRMQARASAAQFVGVRRVRPSDPSFKAASAIVMADVKDIVLGRRIKTDMPGAFIASESIYKDFFTKSIFWFEGNVANEVVKTMTPTEVAVAQALFTQANLGRVKNLSVSSHGIQGTITTKDVSASQLKSMTRANLQKEIAQSTAAMKGLQE